MPTKLKAPKTGRWKERWSVDSDDMEKEYTVARDAAGCFGCSCPRYKFKREQCKHIQTVIEWLEAKNAPHKPLSPPAASSERVIELDSLD